MSFVPIQCNCLATMSRTNSEITKEQHLKLYKFTNTESSTNIKKDIQHSNSTSNSKEEQLRPRLNHQHFQHNPIVNCIQRTVYETYSSANIFTQLNLVCSDKLCVFKISADALKKLISGNFVEENGLTIEMKDSFEEVQRKRILPNTNCTETESIDVKKLKFSENPGVIGDRNIKLNSKISFGAETIIETETLARITWDVSKRCVIHKEPLYFVCELCNRIICSKCIVENHQGHRIVAKNTESAYTTAKTLQLLLNSYIKNIKNLLGQIEVILKEIPYYANEAADCVMGLLDSWEYQGSCIHRRPYLLKLIDTIKTLKIQDLNVQQHNLNHLLFRMESNMKILQQSILNENASNVTYVTMTARHDLEFAKHFDYGFVPIHNKEFRIALKAKTINKPAALTVVSTTVVEPIKKVALAKIPFEESERIWRMHEQQRELAAFQVGPSTKPWHFGKEGRGDGQLCRPWGIVCDKSGRFFVSDRSNNRIQVFNSNGIFAFSFGKYGNRKGELNRPAGVAIDVFDRLIVSDKDNHRIQVFTLNGEYLLHFGTMGNLPGQLHYPWDVCTNSRGEIAVSDTKNRRIQLFTKNGILNGIIDFYPYDLKFFDLPRAVKINTEGELVVGDFNNHHFIVFDQIYSSFKLYGSEGEFNRLQGLCVDSECNYIVADSKNSRVAIYDKNFQLLREIKNNMLKNPQGVCLTPNGNIAVVDMEHHRIVIL